MQQCMALCLVGARQLEWARGRPEGSGAGVRQGQARTAEACVRSGAWGVGVDGGRGGLAGHGRVRVQGVWCGRGAWALPAGGQLCTYMAGASADYRGMWAQQLGRVHAVGVGMPLPLTRVSLLLSPSELRLQMSELNFSR
jgi:hypothetical protein